MDIEMDDIERFIRYHVTSDDVVLDVGANQGLYAKTFAQLAHQVYCLEPNPEAFAILKQNLAAARAANVETLALAASRQSGKVSFFVDKRPGVGGVASSINKLDGMQDFVEEISVETTTLDDLCANKGIAPTFIKVDVEGHEPAVFAGARKIMALHRPVVVFEFWETWWTKGFDSLFSELERDYHLVRIQDGANASSVYRGIRGNGHVDIAALPRRTPAKSKPPRGRGALKDRARGLSRLTSVFK